MDIKTYDWGKIMRKLIFTLFASTLMFSSTFTAAGAETASFANTQPTEAIEQVSSSAAKALSGTYKTKHNSNIRLDAGTKHKVVFVAKKGTTMKATHQKKVGKQTWYKVSANGKSGWVLSTLVSKTTVKAAAKPAPKKATKAVAKPAAKAMSGSFTALHNTNVRKDAGTKHGIVFVAKKGSKVTATHSKKSGSQTWYKVTANGKSGWVLSTLFKKTPAPKKTTKASATAAPSASGIVSTAMALRGTPYKFGGTTKAGFDCSGFTQYVFKQNGKNLSRSTLTQFAETKAVSTPQVGDLVFFANTYRAGISHVGIYIGNNQFIHSGGSKAEVKSLSDSYWGPKFHSFRTKK